MKYVIIILFAALIVSIVHYYFDFRSQYALLSEHNIALENTIIMVKQFQTKKRKFWWCVLY